MSTTEIDKSRDIEELTDYLRNPENEDLFLINTSDLGGRKRRTVVHFNVQNGSGSNEMIVLEDSWLPVNVGIKVDTLKTFARSESFMNLINSGFVRAIDPRFASEFIKSDDARMERGRVREKKRETGGFDIKQDSPVLTQKETDKNRHTASPKVVQIMMNKTLTPEKRYAALRNIENEMTREDVDFVMRHAGEDRVKEWINSRHSAITRA